MSKKVIEKLREIMTEEQIKEADRLFQKYFVEPYEDKAELNSFSSDESDYQNRMVDVENWDE